MSQVGRKKTAQLVETLWLQLGGLENIQSQDENTKCRTLSSLVK